MSKESDSGITTLATQGSITFFGNILGKGLGFAFFAVATRLVTPSQYGLFALGLSVVLFVQGLASLNIYSSVDYFIPQLLDNSEYGRAKKTLQNVFSIGLVASSFGAILVFLAREQIAMLLNEPQLADLLTYLVLLIPLQTVNRTLLTSFHSIKKMKYRVMIRDILNPLTRIAGAVAFISAGLSLLGLIGGYIFGMAVAVLCGIILLIKEVDWVQDAPLRSVSRRSLLSYSLPLVFAGIIYALVGQIDYFVIGYFLNPVAVGQYQVAFLLASNLLIILTAFTPVFKPMIAENRQSKSLLESRYQLATRWVTMLTLPVAITLILAPEIYLSLLFTEEYSLASAAIIALSVGYLLNASLGPEGMVLEGLGHTRLTLLNTLILVGINGLLDVLLIPHLGVLGAGIATGSAITVAGVIGVVEIYLLHSVYPFTKRLFKVWVAAILPCIFGTVIVTFAWGPIQTGLILPPIVICTYLLGLRAIGGFSDDDFELVSQINMHLRNSLV